MLKARRVAGLAVALAWIAAGCSGGGESSEPEAGSSGSLLQVQPAQASVPPGGVLRFSAAISAPSTPSVVWQVSDPAGGSIDEAGQYTAPTTPGTYYVIATAVAEAAPVATAVAVVTVEPHSTTSAPPASSSPAPVAPTPTPTPTTTPTPRPTATPSAPATPSSTATGGPYAFGTRHSPMNRPISDWDPDIRRYYALSASSDLVDPAATADLQAAFTTSSTYGTPYAVFGQVAYVTYFAKAGDPEYPIVDVSGNPRTCNLDAPGTGVRVPAGAMRWSTPSAGPVPVNPASAPDTDIHFTIIDVERNRVYAFYSYGGELFGVTNGKWMSSSRGCDYLHGDDAAVLAAQGYSARYGCKGGSGFPGSACGVAGIGAGIAAGQPFGNGDANGYMGPYGIIMPQDFDDSGFSGEAVGTLHHALRCSAPYAFQYGYMWPTQDPMSGTVGRSLRNGQIFRLDPGYDVEASGASAAEKRVMRTLQRYGCVLNDYGDYGMALFALSAWNGTGPNRSGNPWTAAGGANAEAQSFYTNTNSQGVRFNLRIPTERMQVIRPHGASYPAR